MSLLTKINGCNAGICLYGLAPPKLSTASAELEAIVAQQETRLAPLGLDGLILYDLQDEGERTSAPRPFPFLPTYARGKRIPLGVNVESVSIRKAEIEASVELVRRLRGLIGT